MQCLLPDRPCQTVDPARLLKHPAHTPPYRGTAAPVVPFDPAEDVTTVAAEHDARQCVFAAVKDLQEMTGWSEGTVQKLFNDPKFPSANYGKTKVIEAHTLIQFFAERHEKEKERYWW